MDWPHLKLPDDGDTLHTSPSLLALVDTIIAEQSNHQFTSFFKLLHQYKLSTPTALSITVCEGRQWGWFETSHKRASGVKLDWCYGRKQNLFNDITRLQLQMFNVAL